MDRETEETGDREGMEREWETRGEHSGDRGRERKQGNMRRQGRHREIVQDESREIGEIREMEETGET